MEKRLCAGENSPSVLFNFSILALSGATRQLSKGRALGMAGKFLAEVQSFRERLLPRGELSRSD